MLKVTVTPWVTAQRCQAFATSQSGHLGRRSLQTAQRSRGLQGTGASSPALEPMSEGVRGQAPSLQRVPWELSHQCPKGWQVTGLSS